MMAIKRICWLCAITILALASWRPSAAVAEEPLPNDVPSLVKLLHSTDPAVRGQAAWHLSSLREKAAPAVPDLVVLLGDDKAAAQGHFPNTAVWNAAQTALSAIGQPAVPSLIAALDSPNEKVRERAVIAFVYMNPPPKGVVDALLRRISDPVVSVRRQVPAALSRIGKEAQRAVPTLIGLVDKNPDEYVREAAIGAAGVLDEKGPLAIPACIRALKDDSSEVRGQAARSLGSYGPKAKSAVASLTSALDDQASRRQQISADSCGIRAVRYDVAEALGKIGRDADPALPKLQKMLRSDEDGEVRAIVAQAMLQINPGDDEALPELIALVNNDADGTAGPEAALTVLEGLGPSAAAALPAVNSALRHKEHAVRMQAVAALAAIDGKKAVLPLIEQMKWEHRNADEKRTEDDGADCGDVLVCWSVAEALGKLGADSAPAVPELTSLLANRRLFLPFEGAEVVESLGRIGPAAKDAVPQLIKELSDDDKYLRKTTAVALGRIGPAARAAVPRLLQMADKDSDEDVRKAARAAAKKIAPESRPRSP